MSSSSSDRACNCPLTPNERDYLRLQTQANRRRQQSIVWGLILTSGFLLFFFAFSLSVRFSPFFATGALISAILALVVVHIRSHSVPASDISDASFDIVELSGTYRWFELYTVDNSHNTEYAHSIAGVEVILPSHWIRYVKAGESVRARTARSSNETLYVLSLNKGPKIDQEMDMGRAYLPNLYPNWRGAALVGSISAITVLPGFLIMDASWILLWLVWSVPSFTLGGWFLFHRWRFLRQIDTHYRTQYGLSPMSWWERRGERQGVLPEEAAVVMEEDEKRSTIRSLNEAAPLSVER